MCQLVVYEGHQKVAWIVQVALLPWYNTKMCHNTQVICFKNNTCSIKPYLLQPHFISTSPDAGKRGTSLFPIVRFVRQFNQMWATSRCQWGQCRLNLFDVTPPLWHICLWNLRYRGLHIVIRNDKCDKTSTNWFACYWIQIFSSTTHSSSWSKGWCWLSFVQLSWLKEEWIQLQLMVTNGDQ